MGLLAMVFGENYRYYDTKEGEDCFDKLFYVTKYAACYGVLFSAIDVRLFSHPVGYGPTIARYAYITLPFVGIAAAWSASVCAATNIRKKDDHWNYAIGGIAAGAMVGAWRRSVKIGCYSALAGAALSALKKDSIMNNWNIFESDTKPIINNLWSIRRDFSISTDPPKVLETKYP